MTDEPQWYRDLIDEATAPHLIELTCKVIINGEEIAVRRVADASVYAQPEMRAQVDAGIRHALVTGILERWQPEISARTRVWPAPRRA